MSRRRIKWQVSLVVALVALCTVFTGTSAAVEYFLRAQQVAVAMPDGTNVPMWGFAQDTAFGTIDGAVTVPGPELVVPPGDPTLTIHLDNNLTEPISIVIPGQVATMVPTWTDNSTGARTSLAQRVRSFTHETPPGNAAQVTYTWNNVRPGTYIYHSGTHPQVQVQMGLYGAVKIDAAAGNVYGDPSSAYTNEVVLFYSEIDPVLHDAVATGAYGTPPAPTSTIDYNPKYFLVNGMPYTPGTVPIPAGNAGATLLLRMINAGIRNHVPTLQGQYMSIIAEDGNLYPYPRQQYSVWMPALKTVDAIMTPSAAGYIPVYDRSLYLANNGDTPGGMRAYLEVADTTTWNLTVNTAGVGTGTVALASLPGGIHCDTAVTACGPQPYNAGTSLTLRAEGDPGSHFLGWSGACAARGDCVVTMTADMNVTANFSLFPPSSIGVVRGNTWYLDQNGDTLWALPPDGSFAFGLTTDVPVTGDWNGDGKEEIGVFRDGFWYLDTNGDRAIGLVDAVFRFGQAGDTPVVGDWNNDGIDDVGVKRGRWWYLDSNGSRRWNAGIDAAFTFGAPSDVPAVGDWNGDGVTDVGVKRGVWWYLDSDGTVGWNAATDTAFMFGAPSDVPVVGDWNADGVTDVGVKRGTGWYLDSDGTVGWNAATDTTFAFGSPGDTPVAGNW